MDGKKLSQELWAGKNHKMKNFKRIYIEISNCCNLQCSFCPPTKRRLQTMKSDDFRRVLEAIKGHGDYIYLHIKGEPLLHPELDQLLNLCEAYHLKVTITSNGTLLLKQLPTILAHQCIRQVSISLQSFEGEAQGPDFDRYFEEVLESVNSLRRSSKIISELRLWNYEENDLKGLSNNKNKHVIELIEKRLELNEAIQGRLKKGKGIKLTEQVYLSQSYEFEWPNMSLKEISSVGTCYGLRQQVGILVNGDVVPCCLDSEGDIILGNVFENDFESIVTSPRANNMIEGFQQQHIVEALCKRCGYRKRFD